MPIKFICKDCLNEIASIEITKNNSYRIKIGKKIYIYGSLTEAIDKLKVLAPTCTRCNRKLEYEKPIITVKPTLR